MCGIVGARLPDGHFAKTVEQALERSLEVLHHRGPDDRGVFRDRGLLLAMRRLAILDLEGGAQPLSNEDGTVTVVANGEIYNYLELARELEERGHRFRSRSDTEVLVHLYEEHGADLCGRLRGMFAFALWDGRQQRLVLARDRFGQKPLFYRRLTASQRRPRGGLTFASELQALRPVLQALDHPPEISEQAVYDYLSLAVVPQPGTIWKEVRMLPPGTTLVQTAEGRIRIQTYWSPPAPEALARGASFRQATGRVREAVGEAVRLRLRSDVPLGVFLSGGLDSSVVAWEATRELGESLETFTVSVGDPALDEAPAAAATARHLGVRHTVLPLSVAPADELERVVALFGQPFADPSALPSLAIARLARERVKVVLNGDGGDEVFAGYRRYLAARYARGLPGAALRLLGPLLPHPSARRTALGFLARTARGLTLPPAARYLAWTTDMWREADKRQIWRGGSVRPTEDWLAAVLPGEGSPLARQNHGDLRVNLLSDLLVKMDMATMAASLEARSPLLDHRLAELALSLPESHRVRRGRLKAVLREAYRQLLPPAVLSAPKRGFEIPLSDWLAGDLAPLLRDTVGSPGARVRDFLDGGAVDDLLAGESFGERNRAYLVYALLVLELWLRHDWPRGTPSR